MKRVVIVGGGISGLICSHVFSHRKDVVVKVIEPGAVGGEFLTGGLKYIHETPLVENLFNELDVAWSKFAVKGGIMLRGNVYPYPDCLRNLDRKDVSNIQRDHFRKTRHIEPGKFGSTAMNDPASIKPKKAVRCDFPELIKELAGKVKIIKASVYKIEEGKVYARNSDTSGIIYYDYLVLTMPLWAIKPIVNFYVPSCLAMNLNIAIVNPMVDRYQKWDYVYTPYTPGDSIHRISPDGDDYAVEISGKLNEVDLHSDLNFIFRDGWYIKRIRTGLKGHLLPLEGEPELPENVSLLGRFACWESRMTVDVTLAKSIALRKRWIDG